MKFKIGETVKWTSQSQGYEKTKEGIVVNVVRIGKLPNRRIHASTWLGMVRNHESYVVEVNGRNYWPRVSQLKRR